MFVPQPQGLALAALGVALVAVIVFDIRQRRIPNPIAGAIALGGVAHASLTGGLGGTMASLLGVAAGLALLYIQFSRGLMGAGDVKLLGALGAWTGPLGSLYVVLAGLILGGILSLISLVRLPAIERARVGHNMLAVVLTRNLEVPEPSALSRARGIPFGVALAIAGLGVIVMGAGR